MCFVWIRLLWPFAASPPRTACPTTMIRAPSRFLAPSWRTERQRFKLLNAGLFMLARTYSSDIIFPPVCFPFARSPSFLSGEPRAVFG